MAGSGEVYARHDGRFAFRVIARNGNIVSTDAKQGYENRSDATTTCTRLMAGQYVSGGVYSREDARYGFDVFASQGVLVANDGGQGYENRADAQAVFDALTSGGYDGPVTQL